MKIIAYGSCYIQLKLKEADKNGKNTVFIKRKFDITKKVPKEFFKDELIFIKQQYQCCFQKEVESIEYVAKENVKKEYLINYEDIKMPEREEETIDLEM